VFIIAITYNIFTLIVNYDKEKNELLLIGKLHKLKEISTSICYSYNEYNIKLHEKRKTTLNIFHFFIFYSKCLESFSNCWTRLCSFVNKSLDSRIPRGARTYTWCHSLTARHPFWMRLGFLAYYNSDNYVTNASKDKELLSDVDGSLACSREPKETWLLGSPAAGNPPFVICLYDPPPFSVASIFFCGSFLARFTRIFYSLMSHFCHKILIHRVFII